MYRLPPLSTSLAKSAAYTATQHLNIPKGYSSIQIRIKTTAKVDTPSVVPTIEAWDEAAGEWYTLLTGVAITDVNDVLLTVAEWATASANVAVKQKAPHYCRLVMTHADTDALTYSVAAWLHE